jgi:hypothetical protein
VLCQAMLSAGMCAACVMQHAITLHLHWCVILRACLRLAGGGAAA